MDLGQVSVFIRLSPCSFPGTRRTGNKTWPHLHAWQRASSWQLAKHQIWLRTVRSTPSSSQSHPRHRGGAIWSHQDSLPGVQTTATKGQAPKSKLWNTPSTPPTFMTFLRRRCAGTVPHTSARDFRESSRRVCVFLTVVECPTAKMLVYRPY